VEPAVCGRPQGQINILIILTGLTGFSGFSGLLFSLFPEERVKGQSRFHGKNFSADDANLRRFLCFRDLRDIRHQTFWAE
jgi:hypothetical protein